MTDNIDELNLDSIVEDEEHNMTSGQVLSLLEQAWLNEKFAPELLPHKSEIIDCMLDQLNAMQQNLERVKKQDIKICIHKLEVERIRFVLSSYLRRRLQKIECFAAKLLSDEEDINIRMTPEEYTFAKEYQANIESHLNNLALKHMPRSLQNIESKVIMPGSNLNGFVFMQVDQSIDGVIINDGLESTQENEVMDLISGDQHIICYAPIKDLINTGHVSLI